MSTLYTQADSNIKKTWLFMSVFLIFIIALGWLFSYLLESPIILWIAVIFSVFANFAGYWYSDKIVLATTKASPIEKKDNPELYRIVENLSITAGLPVPKIYILEESQPNAFATGRNAQHAVIAVTRGLLNKLDRTELEAVLAHELSHIGNKDMLLSTMVVILAGFVSVISNMFLRINYFGGNKRRNNDSGSAIFLVVGILAAILAPLFATLMRMAISRKREFLADASGVLLTRYPDGLIRALEKISEDKDPLRVANNATSHLYISNPFKGQKVNNKITNLFMTHPPIEERIAALKELKV
jgi:heat shock protein HtpX